MHAQIYAQTHRYTISVLYNYFLFLPYIHTTKTAGTCVVDVHTYTNRQGHKWKHIHTHIHKHTYILYMNNAPQNSTATLHTVVLEIDHFTGADGALYCLHNPISYTTLFTLLLANSSFFRGPTEFTSAIFIFAGRTRRSQTTVSWFLEVQALLARAQPAIYIRVCIWVCVCVYLYLHTHTHTHHTRTAICVRMWICMSIYINICMYVCIHIYERGRNWTVKKHTHT
jgi:hypothetical protein